MNDLVEDIEAIALSQIKQIRIAAELPDSIMDTDTVERVDMLLDIVLKVRREQRDQRKYVASLPDEDLDAANDSAGAGL